MSQATERDEKRPSKRRPIPAWQKFALAFSLLFALAGGALWVYDAATAQDRAQDAAAAPQRSTGSPSAPSGLAPQSFAPSSGRPAPTPDAPPAPDADADPAHADPSPLQTWSPALFRLGFSFFVGFCIAYAARTFLRITIVIIGAGLLGLAALQYFGVITVNWAVLEGQYDTAAAWLTDQTTSFTRFLSGYLPSAASATAGLVIGFRGK